LGRSERPAPLPIPRGGAAPRVACVASNEDACVVVLDDGRAFGWGLMGGSSDGAGAALARLDDASALKPSRAALFGDGSLVVVEGPLARRPGTARAFRRTGRRAWAPAEEIQGSLAGACAADVDGAGARVVCLSADGRAHVLARSRDRVDAARLGDAGASPARFAACGDGFCVLARVDGAVEERAFAGDARTLDWPGGRVTGLACFGAEAVAATASGALVRWRCGGAPALFDGFRHQGVTPTAARPGPGASVAASTAGNVYAWGGARAPAIVSHFCDAGLCVEDVWGLHCAGGPQFLAAVNGARDDRPEPEPAAKPREIWADALAGVPADFWRGDAERRATKRRPARAAALPRARKPAAARTAVFGALVDGGPLETGVAHACVVVLKDAAGRDVARGGWAVAAAAAGDAGAVAAAAEDRGDGTVAVSATPPRRSTYVELAVSVDGAPVGPFRVPCYDAAPSPRAPPDEPGAPPRLAPAAPPPEAAVALCPRRTKLLALPSARDAGAQVVLRAVDAAGAAVGATAAAAACDVAAAARVAGGALAPVAAALADGIGALTVDVDRPAGAAEATVAVTVAAPGGARVPGQQKRAKFPTSKAHISAGFHSFRLIFGRAIIPRNGLEAWMLFPERARAEHSC